MSVVELAIWLEEVPGLGWTWIARDARTSAPVLRPEEPNDVWPTKGRAEEEAERALKVIERIAGAQGVRKNVTTTEEEK